METARTLDSRKPNDPIAPPAAPLERLLTISEACALLRLHERTIRRMVASRRMPCVRLGRQLRFSPYALSRWLQAREEG
jgi:excisionase family DNA binding protein